MKKYYFLMIVALILGLLLTGCSLLSNISQVPATEQSSITSLTKGPAPNLVGLWHFDEGSGTTAFDSSVYGNNGTIIGATWEIPGKFGNALSFNGSSDYVNAGSDASFDFTGKFTVEAWINGEFEAYYDLMVFRGYSNWAFGYFRTGRLMFGETAWNSLWTRQIYSDTLLWTPGQWYHIAVVYDTVGKTADFYRDGVPVGVGKQSTDKFGITNSGNVTIGYPHSVSFNGLIDEVRIWDIALTADQLILYDNYSGLLAPYKGPDKAFKSGSSIPLRWQYTTDDILVAVNSSTANPSIKIDPVEPSGEPIDGTLIVADDPGSSGYHYDSETNTWHFNWKTEGYEAGDYNVYIINDWTGQTFGPSLIRLR